MENDEITPAQEPIFEIEETPFVPIRNKEIDGEGEKGRWKDIEVEI